ncbi:hypothetical protein KY284_001172 [Solanum tuberosum]|nr:hypothetical protein KY284_001172 [Solanum tuberosum]
MHCSREALRKPYRQGGKFTFGFKARERPPLHVQVHLGLSLSQIWQWGSPREDPRTMEDPTTHGAPHVEAALAHLGSEHVQVRVHDRWTCLLPVYSLVNMP